MRHPQDGRPASRVRGRFLRSDSVKKGSLEPPGSGRGVQGMAESPQAGRKDDPLRRELVAAFLRRGVQASARGEDGGVQKRASGRGHPGARRELSAYVSGRGSPHTLGIRQRDAAQQVPPPVVGRPDPGGAGRPQHPRGYRCILSGGGREDPRGFFRHICFEGTTEWRRTNWRRCWGIPAPPCGG